MDPFSTPVASPYSSLENQHYAKLWKIADPESKGVLGPQQAVLFLTKSLLEQATLSQIWKLSDSDSKGYLNQQDFFKALKLVSIAQAEKPLSTPLSTTTLLPTFKGILDSSAPTQPMQFQNTGVTQPMQFQNTGESTLSRATTSIRPVQKLDAGSFTVTAEERTRFTSFFEASNPIDGFLSGDVVKGIFMKSQLPNETLGKVWQLVDKEGKGKFSANQFINGMAILTRIKAGTLPGVPASIPALDEPRPLAGLNSFNPMDSFLPTNTPSVPAINFLEGITEAERAQYTSFFTMLDTSAKGTLSGGECSSVFLKSKLPATDLAQIWELVDTSKSGSINKEGFITAMYLIKKRMTGAPIPSAQPQPEPLLQQDLLSLGNEPSMGSPIGTISPSLPNPIKPITSILEPQKTGDLLGRTSAAGFGFTPLAPTSTSIPQSTSLASNTTIPFAPTTGATTALSLEAKELALREQTLNIRKQELENFQDQLSELKPTAEELKKKRDAIEAEYKSVTDKRNASSLELSQLRATYEAELAIVKDTQEILFRDSKVLQQTQIELAQYTEAVRAIKAEHANVLEQKNKQQTDLADMKKKIVQLTEESNVLRAATTKLAAEFKQQQQLVEVNMKLLQSTQEDYKIIKQEHDQELAKVDAERKRALQIEQQNSVQEAIIIREREKLAQMEREKNKHLERSQILLQSKENLATEIDTIKSLSQTDMSKPDITGFDLPDSPAPPIPSSSTKPLKVEPDATATALGMSQLNKSTESLSLSQTSPVKAKEDKKVLERQASMDLASLMEGNKPKQKSPTKSDSLNTPKSTSSMPIGSTYSKEVPTPASAASLPNPPVGSKSPFTPNQVLESPADFEMAFPPIPKANGSPIKNVGNLDMAAEMEKAFTSTVLKPAKDTPSLTSQSKLNQKKADLDDPFKFDASFSTPAPGVPIGFDSFPNVAPSTKSNGFDDFGDFNASFSSAPLPPPNANPTADLNAAFGSPNPKPSQSPAFDLDDPFGTADFSNAFSTPFPPPSNAKVPVIPGSPPKSASSPTHDSTEVKSIMSMGFTKEQAVNALEIHSFNLESAINYLVESVAK